MSNKASNTLHELIHSLTSAEKRYFKLFSNRHSTSNQKQYVQLFDEIDNQKEYDETEILEVFKENSFTKHFSIAKNRLYHQILKSLDAFYSQDTSEAEINQYVHYSEILFQKALYNQCSKILNTASKLALKYEKWPALLQIIKRQKRLLELQNYEESKGLSTQTLVAQETEVLEKLSIEMELWQAKSTLFKQLFTKGQVRDKKNASKLLPLLKNVEKIGDSSKDSFEASFLRNHTKSAYYFALGNYTSSYDSLKSNIDLMRANLNLVKDEPSIYISVLTNLIYVCAKLNKLEESDYYLAHSRNLPKELKSKINKDLELRVFTNTFSLELAILNISADDKRAEKLLPQVEKELEKWEDKLSDVRRASFYHSISTLFFIIGNNRKSLRWNNKLLNTINIDQSEDQYCFGQIFHLLIHFEMNNMDVVSHSMKSLKRYLKTRKRKYKFEDLFIDLMQSILSTTDDKHNKLLMNFQEEMKKLSKNKFEQIVLEYFDFISWAESKTSDKSLQEILQEKAPQKDIL